MWNSANKVTNTRLPTPMERIQCVQPSADLTIPSTQTIQTTKSDFPYPQLQQTSHRLQWARKQQNPFLCFLFLIFFRVFLYLTEKVKNEKIAQRVPFHACTQIPYFRLLMLIWYTYGTLIIINEPILIHY